MIQAPSLQLEPIRPELILAGAAIIALLLDALVPRTKPITLLLISLAGLAGAAAACLELWEWKGGLTVLGGTVAVDRFTVVARLIIIGAAAMGAIYGFFYFQQAGEFRGEFFPLLLFAATGMTLITAAADLIVVFLALEILSLSLYVLTGISSRLSAGEAAMKYFLLGAFSSAFFLYGVALAYGATGTTHIVQIVHELTGSTGSSALALAAIGLLAVGFAFKVSAVPFHMWTPDVYQGAPTAVTAFMSAATKVAAFAALIRVFDVAFFPLSWDWTPVVWVLATASIVVGSVLALAQTDIKRMLAYSSIAHAGFIFTGIIAANQDGIQAALFYLVAYSAMILGAFGVVMLVSGRGEEHTSVSAYAGLARRRPALAALMTLFLLSLAGIPPTAGFIAKVDVFGAAVRAGHWELALIGVLGSVVAAFFYLRVIVLMYMQAPVEVPEEEAAAEREPELSALPLAAPALLTLVLGVFPELVLGFLRSAAILRW
jgi:NADH-quinone oxidoreductase subunit N